VRLKRRTLGEQREDLNANLREEEFTPILWVLEWTPVEIGEGCLTAVPESEVRHKHSYHEYYVVLVGIGFVVRWLITAVKRPYLI
jgi:hypothetical protein